MHLGGEEKTHIQWRGEQARGDVIEQTNKSVPVELICFCLNLHYLLGHLQEMLISLASSHQNMIIEYPIHPKRQEQKRNNMENTMCLTQWTFMLGLGLNF